MSAKRVTIDSVVVKWITDPLIRQALLAMSARMPADMRDAEVCSVDVRDSHSKQLSRVPVEAPDVQYSKHAPASPKAEEYFGPMWFEDSQTLFVGHFSNKVKNGRGLLIGFSDSRMLYCYEGYFQDDKQDGTGRVFFANGDWYSGEFKAGHAKGLGEYRNNSKQYLYVGHFDNDIPQGHGTETWDDGSVYRGDFVKGKKHGNGKFMTEGGVLEGNFADGEFHGEGKMVSQTEKVFEGNWKNSILQSPARIHFKGSKYEGHIDNEYLPHGEGKVLNSSREIKGHLTGML